MPNCGYCKDCTWWVAPWWEDNDEDPHIPGGWQWCKTDNWAVDRALMRTVPTVDQLLGDGELVTAPDFGCIQWEAKE